MSNPIGTTEAALVPGVSALPDNGSIVEAPLTDVAHRDLKRRTAHGAFVSLVAQAANFVLRFCFGKSGFYGSLLRATKMVRISTGHIGPNVITQDGNH